MSECNNQKYSICTALTAFFLLLAKNLLTIFPHFTLIPAEIITTKLHFLKFIPPVTAGFYFYKFSGI